MSALVRACLSVREDISGTARAIFTIFVHVAYMLLLFAGAQIALFTVYASDR